MRRALGALAPILIQTGVTAMLLPENSQQEVDWGRESLQFIGRQRKIIKIGYLILAFIGI